MSNDLINEKRIYDSEQEHAHDMSYENETSRRTDSNADIYFDWVFISAKKLSDLTQKICL